MWRRNEKTSVSSLWFDPLLISMYECAAGGGIGRHDHTNIEPCHITIVASGSIAVTAFDAENNEVSREVVKAPNVHHYSDGREAHHKIEALEDGTVFYNIPRVIHTERKHIAKDIFGDG